MAYTPQGQLQIPQNGVPLSPPDYDVAKYVNNLPKDVPADMRKLVWGYMNSLLGLTFLSEREAQAQVAWVYSMAQKIVDSVPPRKIDDAFMVDISNFIEICKLKIYQSKLRPKGGMNERTTMATQTQETVTSGSGGGGSSGRKHLIPGLPF